MSYETIQVESKDASTVHVLVGTVKEIGNNIVTVDIDNYGLYEDIPVFYHCENSAEVNDGMPFVCNDRAIIINYGSVETLSVVDMRVVGFEDGLPRGCTETVFISIAGGGSEQCFIWDVKKNKYAEVNNNEGNPVTFPCDLVLISNWRNRQKSVGIGLYSALACGRSQYYQPEIVGSLNKEGTTGSNSASAEEPSNCGCSFIDTAECTYTWDLTNKCYYQPDSPSNPEAWTWTGSSMYTHNSDVLWRGSVWEQNKPQVITFQNNSGVESAFRIELQSNTSKVYWWCSGFSCGGEPCDNNRLDENLFGQKFKVHTPIKQNILEINYAAEETWDYCNDLGMRTEENNLKTLKLYHVGKYSDRVITQIYAAEARTVTRNRNCAIDDSGTCLGLGCVGDTCPWVDEVYTTYGLSISAQVDLCKDTDGIDPTGLSTNSSFEEAIIDTYKALRAVLETPEDRIIGISIGCTIYKGA